MWSRCVVIVHPGADGAARMIETEEQALIQQLVTHPAVEALDEGVLRRPARSDVMPVDAMLGAPGEDGVRGQLGPVIRDDHAGLATPFDQRCQLPGDALAGDRGVGDRRQAFARDIIDDVQNAEAPAAGELIMHEVQGPASIDLGLDQDRRSRANGPSPGTAAAHRQPFLTIEPVDPVAAGGLAFSAQQDEEAPVAEPPTGVGEIAEPATQLGIGRPAGSIADAGAIGGDDGAGPTLAHLEHRPQMSDSFALGGGPYHFFASSSRRAEASSIDSARSFFSFAFSSSSAFSRLASDDLHAAELGLPVVQRRFRHPVLPAQIGGLGPRLVLPQYRDDLLFRKSAPLHRSVPRLGRTLTPSGGTSQGQVTD